MRNFRDAYKHAVDELPEFHMDVGRVRDEHHHRRMVAARRRRAFVSAAAAACVFLICGVGTATAMNYYSSTIKVREHGFSFQGKDAVILLEENSQDNNAVNGDDADNGRIEAARAGGGEMAAGQDVPAGTFQEGSGSGPYETEPAGVEAVVQDLDETRYDTIEEFRAAEDVTIAIPDITWLGDPEEIECQEVILFGDPPKVMVRIRTQESSFYMSQDDNRAHPNYASSKVFSGDVVNERMITNDQGLAYTVFDTQEDGEITATHAAVSINGRDLTLDFYGYDEETVSSVLKRLDLSIYVTDE